MTTIGYESNPLLHISGT